MFDERETVIGDHQVTVPAADTPEGDDGYPLVRRQRHAQFAHQLARARARRTWHEHRKEAAKPAHVAPPIKPVAAVAALSRVREHLLGAVGTLLHLRVGIGHVLDAMKKFYRTVARLTSSHGRP